MIAAPSHRARLAGIGLSALVATSAHASLAGVGFIVDDADSAAATATFGFSTTVIDFFVAFTEADDLLDSIQNIQMQTLAGSPLIQTGVLGGTQDTDGDVNPAFFGFASESEWDTYVGIGGPFLGTSNAIIDPDFAFTATGVQGGWTDTAGPGGSRQGAGVFDAEFGLYLTWAGQFVIEGSFTGGDISTSLFFIGQFGQFGLLADRVTVNWLDTLGAESQSRTFRIPAPGAAALFGVAALGTARRRRGLSPDRPAPPRS